MNRQLAGWLAGACVLLLGCQAQRHSPAPPTTTAAALSPTTASPTASALELLLAQQFDMGMSGAGPHGCLDDLALIKHRPSAGHPLAWVSSYVEMADKVTVRLGRETLLCLSGFPKDKPVTITVRTGGRQYTVPVRHVAKDHAASPDDNALFDGRTIDVEDAGDDLQESAFWRFLPADPARKSVALAGRLPLTAKAGTVETSYEVPLSWEAGAAALEKWERSRKIAVFGYPVGATVPIGLYRVGEQGQEAVLERKVGHVVMPASRVALFTVPKDVFRLVSEESSAGEDVHCLSVPQERQACMG
ncbi:hypothetical protein [Streptomyces sp. 1222.5]|uniref:hypothetical protein n=1 Tax=Streptomyces sp. 1222.5 TaxID=1881026 RepID=UPI003D704412